MPVEDGSPEFVTYVHGARRPAGTVGQFRQFTIEFGDPAPRMRKNGHTVSTGPQVVNLNVVEEPVDTPPEEPATDPEEIVSFRRIGTGTTAAHDTTSAASSGERPARTTADAAKVKDAPTPGTPRAERSESLGTVITITRRLREGAHSIGQRLLELAAPAQSPVADARAEESISAAPTLTADEQSAPHDAPQHDEEIVRTNPWVRSGRAVTEGATAPAAAVDTDTPTTTVPLDHVTVATDDIPSAKKGPTTETENGIITITRNLGSGLLGLKKRLLELDGPQQEATIAVDEDTAPATSTAVERYTGGTGMFARVVESLDRYPEGIPLAEDPVTISESQLAQGIDDISEQTKSHYYRYLRPLTEAQRLREFLDQYTVPSSSHYSASAAMPRYVPAECHTTEVDKTVTNAIVSFVRSAQRSLPDLRVDPVVVSIIDPGAQGGRRTVDIMGADGDKHFYEKLSTSDRLMRLLMLSNRWMEAISRARFDVIARNNARQLELDLLGDVVATSVDQWLPSAIPVDSSVRHIIRNSMKATTAEIAGGPSFEKVYQPNDPQRDERLSHTARLSFRLGLSRDSIWSANTTVLEKLKLDWSDQGSDPRALIIDAESTAQVIEAIRGSSQAARRDPIITAKNPAGKDVHLLLIDLRRPDDSGEGPMGYLATIIENDDGKPEISSVGIHGSRLMEDLAQHWRKETATAKD